MSKYKSYDELSLMLSVPEIAAVLGISRAAAYKLARSIDKIPTARRNAYGRTRTGNNEYLIHDLSALDPSA